MCGGSYFKEKEVPTITISSQENSTLAKLGSVVIVIPALEKKFLRTSNIASEACMEYGLNILYSLLYSQLNVSSTQFD